MVYVCTKFRENINFDTKYDLSSLHGFGEIFDKNLGDGRNDRRKDEWTEFNQYTPIIIFKAGL